MMPTLQQVASPPPRCLRSMKGRWRGNTSGDGAEDHKQGIAVNEELTASKAEGEGREK